MNIATIVILAIVGICVWIAIRTLRKNKGHNCSGCKSCGNCDLCNK